MNMWKKSYVNYQLCFIVMECKLKVKQIKVHLTGNALICIIFIISCNENVIFVYVMYISFIDIIFKRRVLCVFFRKQCVLKNYLFLYFYNLDFFE